MVGQNTLAFCESQSRKLKTSGPKQQSTGFGNLPCTDDNTKRDRVFLSVDEATISCWNIKGTKCN
jgi:hypothetical protein